MSKIALVCNINNLMFPTARYLAAEGHDVTLFLLDEYSHFLPENDCYSPDERLKIVTTGWKKELFHTLSEKLLSDTFKGFDCYIGTEIAPAVLYKAGIRMDVFFPAGTDMNEYPFREQTKRFPDNWEIDLIEFAVCQRLGLFHCRSVIYEGGDEFTYEAFEKIPYKGEIIPYCIPYIYTGEYDTDEKISQSAYFSQFKAIRDASDLMVLCHSRQVWHDPQNKHTKGSDILINGFKQFTDKNPDYKASLILFEYGIDVQRSKDLIESLGIKDKVFWMPAMSRKHLMAGIRLSDICAGNMSIPAYMYCSVCEIISQAKAAMQYGVDHENNVYPYLKSRSAENVAAHLQTFITNRQAITDTGKKAQAWLMDQNVEKPLAAIRAVLKDTTRNTEITGRWQDKAYRHLWFLQHMVRPINKMGLILKYGVFGRIRSMFKVS